MKYLILITFFAFTDYYQKTNREYPATVLAVYDGDTLTMDISLGLGAYRLEKVRLEGINAPEVRGLKKAKGLISRDALSDKLLGKNIVIKTKNDKRGKYGRLIATLYADDENINIWMVENGYAVYKEY